MSENSTSANAHIRPLFRIIVPKFSEHNVFSRPAKKTVSLSAVMIATQANKLLPWLDVEVIDENNYRGNLGAPIQEDGNPNHLALQEERPAVFIGLCCSMTNSMPRSLELVQLYRTDTHVMGIIAGGWHVHYEPTEILKAGADIVVHGEGEAVIADCITALYQRKPINTLPGISFMDGSVLRRNEPYQLLFEKLDELPIPDFSLVRYAKISIFPISRIRGCSGRCKFCSVKGRPRSISAKRFLNHVQNLISLGAKEFFLVDDRVEEDRDGSLQFFTYLAEFCQKRRLRIEITVQARLSTAEDLELLAAMKRAGVTNIAIGYESPIVSELRAMRKPIRPEKMLEWTSVFKKYGFFIHAMFIFGYPLERAAREQFIMSAKERAKHFWEFIKRASRVGVDTIQILLLTPLVGTEVRSQLKEEGRLYDVDWGLYDGTWLVFQPDEGVDPKELQLELTRLMRKFYAFNYLWRMRVIALLAHLVQIGIVSVVVYVAFFFSGFRYKPWYRKWRNSVLHFGAHLIIWKWLNNFKESKFIAKLRRMKQAR